MAAPPNVLENTALILAHRGRRIMSGCQLNVDAALFAGGRNPANIAPIFTAVGAMLAIVGDNIGMIMALILGLRKALAGASQGFFRSCCRSRYRGQGCGGAGGGLPPPRLPRVSNRYATRPRFTRKLVHSAQNSGSGPSGTRSCRNP